MTSLLFGLWLFGGLLGGGDATSDCRQSPEEAARTLQAIERQWPLRPTTDPVTRYVQRLGMRLIRAYGIPNEGRWRFAVVRNLEPIAFALGGGQFVVSDGLIAFVPSESELAAVLAHEIAHEHLGHFCRGPTQARRRIRMGSIVQHFELELEIAADAAAVGFLVAGGFDPDSMARVLDCLMRRPGGGNTEVSARLMALGRNQEIAAGTPERASPEFARIQKAVADELGGGAWYCR